MLTIRLSKLKYGQEHHSTLSNGLSELGELKPFVLEIDGIIVAYADLQVDGYIDHFFVAGKYSRRGLGSLLMGHIVENAIAKGITALTADVSMNAQNFFASFGFVIVEQRSRKKHGLALPNVLMSCEISTLKDMFSSDL
jgi:putative acetyltransferase